MPRPRLAPATIPCRIAANLAVLGLCAAGCQSSPPAHGRPEPSSAVPASPAPPDATVPRSAGASDPASRTQALESLQPRRTRGGQLRFSQEQIHGNPLATQVFLARLQTEPAPEMRAALAEALPRTGGDWVDGAIARLVGEPDATVRRVLVSIMPKAQSHVAGAAIAQALTDTAAEVRAEAALAAGSMPPRLARETGLLDGLRARLQDADGHTRAGAARSLGVLGAIESFATIEPLLGDDDPTVRLQALRALGRLDADRAANLPALQRLSTDPDPKVARAASRIVDRSR